MANNDHIDTSLLVLNDVLSDISSWDAENGDILNEEIASIHLLISVMQKKIARRHTDEHMVIDGKCTVCDYAGHDVMQEKLL